MIFTPVNAGFRCPKPVRFPSVPVEDKWQIIRLLSILTEAQQRAKVV